MAGGAEDGDGGDAEGGGDVHGSGVVGQDEVAGGEEFDEFAQGGLSGEGLGLAFEVVVHFVADGDFVLTNDSGPMHVASALGVPTVAIFGSTSHIATGPTGPLSRVIREPVPCSPCFERECPLTDPAAHLACLRLVTPGRVVREALQLLGERYTQN